jgi:hypothetical protein
MRTVVVGKLQVLRESHTLGVKAKPRGERRLGIDPPRQIGRLAPDSFIG